MVNFKIGEKNHSEDEIISMSRVWDKEKISVPDRIRTYELPNTWQALVSYGELMESEAIY